MKFERAVVGGGVEILAADDFTAIPIQLQIVSNPSVVKAGTPLTAAGAKALDGSGAVGILLYDVDTAVNPNGALVVAGVIDYTKIVANAGVTATAATLKSAIPTIIFRDDIGVNPVMTASASAITVSASGTKTFTLSNAVGTVTVVSSATGKATVTVSSSTVTVTGVAAGSAVVTCTDALGHSVSVDVTVS